MIRTHILPCTLPRLVADALNLASGAIYIQVLGCCCAAAAVSHWRVVRHKGHWLSEKAGTRWSDLCWPIKPLHAHTIDAVQQGFYNACRTTRALRKAGCTDAKFPHWRQRFRTTIWKNTAIKKDGAVLTLSNGKGNRAITLTLPAHLAAVLRVLEVRLVFDKKAHRYTWHVVVENGTQPKTAPGGNVVSVDLGEVHPGDVRDVADGVNHGRHNNQKISGWSHGKIRAYIEYKAQAEGIRVVLQDEHYTSQTCPQCGHRHKPHGRVYICGQCGFNGHRDVVGQINILSAYTTGKPGKLPAPALVKHRMLHNLRLMRRRRDTGQALSTCRLENSHG